MCSVQGLAFTQQLATAHLLHPVAGQRSVDTTAVFHQCVPVLRVSLDRENTCVAHDKAAQVLHLVCVTPP